MAEKIVTGLFYPAVLGAIIYKLLSEVFGPAPGVPSIFISIAIIAHYTTDYSASLLLNTERSYNVRSAVCDCVIIVALFVAGNCIWMSSSLHWLFPHALFPAMVFTKVFTVLWDKTRFGRPLRATSDMLFGLGYLASALLTSLFVVERPGWQAFLEIWPPVFIWPFLFVSADAVSYAHFLRNVRKAKR